MADKVKIVANYTVFYGEEFIEQSVKSIYDYVDRIHIAIGKMSWKNHLGKRSKPIDNLLGKVKTLPDPDKKIRVFKGMWENDTEQRNFLLDKSIGKYDYAMLIDSDEVWEKAHIKKLVEVARDEKDNPKVKVISVGIIHYFKSLYYAFHGPTQKVNYLFKADGSIRHEWIRHPGTMPIFHAPVYYHHYGYAYPPEIVEKKIRMWGHSSEVIENWYETTYKLWQPKGNSNAMSPTGDLWEPLIKRKLIKEMKGHRLSRKEYYGPKFF